MKNINIIVFLFLALSVLTGYRANGQCTVAQAPNNIVLTDNGGGNVTLDFAPACPRSACGPNESVIWYVGFYSHSSPAPNGLDMEYGTHTITQHCGNTELPMSNGGNFPNPAVCQQPKGSTCLSLELSQEIGVDNCTWDPSAICPAGISMNMPPLCTGVTYDVYMWEIVVNQAPNTCADANVGVEDMLACALWNIIDVSAPSAVSTITVGGALNPMPAPILTVSGINFCVGENGAYDNTYAITPDITNAAGCGAVTDVVSVGDLNTSLDITAAGLNGTEGSNVVSLNCRDVVSIAVTPGVGCKGVQNCPATTGNPSCPGSGATTTNATLYVSTMGPIADLVYPNPTDQNSALPAILGNTLTNTNVQLINPATGQPYNACTPGGQTDVCGDNTIDVYPKNYTSNFGCFVDPVNNCVSNVYPDPFEGGIKPFDDLPGVDETFTLADGSVHRMVILCAQNEDPCNGTAGATCIRFISADTPIEVDGRACHITCASTPADGMLVLENVVGGSGDVAQDGVTTSPGTYPGGYNIVIVSGPVTGPGLFTNIAGTTTWNSANNLPAGVYTIEVRDILAPDDLASTPDVYEGAIACNAACPMEITIEILPPPVQTLTPVFAPTATCTEVQNVTISGTNEQASGIADVVVSNNTPTVFPHVSNWDNTISDPTQQSSLNVTGMFPGFPTTGQVIGNTTVKSLCIDFAVASPDLTGLDLYLISPDGTVINFIWGTAFVGGTLSGSAPSTVCFTDANVINAFNAALLGTAANGTWTISMYNAFSVGGVPQTVAINGWELTLANQQLTTTSNITDFCTGDVADESDAAGAITAPTGLTWTPAAAGNLPAGALTGLMAYITDNGTTMTDVDFDTEAAQLANPGYTGKMCYDVTGYMIGGNFYDTPPADNPSCENGLCCPVTTTICFNVLAPPDPPAGTGLTICQSNPVPSCALQVSGCTCPPPQTGSVSFSAAGLPLGFDASPPLNIFADPAVLAAQLPAGATYTGITYTVNGTTIGGSGGEDVNVTLTSPVGPSFGGGQSVTNPACNYIAPAPWNYSGSVLAGDPTFAGGTWVLAVSDCFSGDVGGPDNSLNVATVNYVWTLPSPVSSTTWWDTPITGTGTQQGATNALNLDPTGLVGDFDPDGAAGPLPSVPGTTVDVNIPGEYTLYAQCDCNGCASDRTPVVLVVEPGSIGFDYTDVCLADVTGGLIPYPGPAQTLAGAFSISPNTITIDPTTGEIDASALACGTAPTNYLVTFAPSGGNPCSYTDQVLITPRACPPAPVVGLTVCEGVDISASTISSTCAACPALPCGTDPCTAAPACLGPLAPAAPITEDNTAGPVDYYSSDCCGPGNVGDPVATPNGTLIIPTPCLPVLPSCATNPVISWSLTYTISPAGNGSWSNEVALVVEDGAGTIIFGPNGGSLPGTTNSNASINGTITGTGTPTGPFQITVDDGYDDGGVNGTISATFSYVLNYDAPTIVAPPPVAATVTWWDSPTGGTQQGTGGSLVFDGLDAGFDADANPVTPDVPTAVSSNTPGTYTFYAQCECSGCESTREPVEVVVNPSPTASTGTYGPYCESDGLQNLTGAPIPAAGETGTWSGISVTNNADGTGDFDPAGQSGASPINVTYSFTDANGCSNAASTQIVVSGATTLTDATASVCEDALGSGSAAGQDLTAFEAGMGAVVVTTETISWFDGATDITATAGNVTVNNGDLYTLEFTNDNGCISTATVTFTVNALPTLTNETPSVCEDLFGGGSAAGQDLTAFEAGMGAVIVTTETINWFDGATNITSTAGNVTVSNGDIYTLEFTDANGCTNTATVIYTVNALPTLTDATTSVCEDALGSGSAAGQDLTAFEAGMGAVVVTTETISWFDGAIDITATAGNVTVNNGDVFTLQFTDANGCVNTATVTYTVNSLPTLNNQTDIVCEDLFGVGTAAGQDLTAFESGMGAVIVTTETIVWLDGVTDITSSAGNVTVSNGDVYTLEFTDANGCTNTATLTYTVNPLPTITGNAPICAGSTNQLTGTTAGVGTATPTWSSGTPSVATVSSSGLVTAVSAGTSVITYTDNNGCVNTVTVTVNGLPTITGNAPICVGFTNQLTGSTLGAGTAIPTWVSATTSVATVSITGLVTAISAGTSVITYTDNNGCVSTITVTVNSLPNVTVTVADACFGVNHQLEFVNTGGTLGSYSIDYNASTNAAGAIDVSSTPIGASPITLFSSAILPGTYGGSITFNTINGCTQTVDFSFVVLQCCVADAGQLVDIANFCENTLTGFFAEQPYYSLPNVDPNTVPGAPTYSYAWVLVQASTGNILSVNTTDGYFNTLSLPAGSYCVYGLSYKNDPADPFDGINFSSGNINSITDVGGNTTPWVGGNACIDATQKCFNVITGCGGPMFVAIDPCVCMDNGNANGTGNQFSVDIEIVGGVGPYTLSFSSGPVYAYNVSNAINTPITLTSVVADADGITNLLIKFDSGVMYDLTITDATGNVISFVDQGGCDAPVINNFTADVCNDITSINLYSYGSNFTLSNGTISSFVWVDGASNVISNPNSVNPNNGPFSYVILSDVGCHPVGVLNINLIDCTPSGTADIGGVNSYVWYDADHDGLYDLPEPFTDLDGDGHWDAGEPFVDVDGNGVFDGPAELWTDSNANGQWDPGEPYVDSNGDGVYTNGTTDFGIPGVTVIIYSTVGPDGIPGTADDNDPITITTTDSDGLWTANNLPVFDSNGNVISYYVQFPTSVNIDGYTFPLTLSNVLGVGVPDVLDNDANSNGTTIWFNLNGGDISNIAAGYVGEVVINTVDINFDQIQLQAGCTENTLLWSSQAPLGSTFEIQRSNDGLLWTTVANIAASTNTNYSYTDVFSATMVTYYRISLQSISSSAISSIVYGSNECEDGIEVIQIYPNPITNSPFLNISLISNVADIAAFDVIDMNGRVLISENISLQSGKQTYQINTEMLAQAPYVLSIQLPNAKKQYYKFVKSN